MNEFIKKELDELIENAKKDDVILNKRDELLFRFGFKYGVLTAGGALANFDIKVEVQ